MVERAWRADTHTREVSCQHGSVTSQPSGDGVDRTLRLDPVPTSAGAARRAVGDAVIAAGRADLADTAGLLVTELVTNAIVHARTPIQVTIAATSDGVRVEVMDASPHVPVRRGYGTSATTGRGVAVVELLAHRFGTDPITGIGKTVWFELGTTAATEMAEGPSVEPDAQEQLTVNVQLLHLPVTLARAWQQHADALLREHLLSCWDGDGEHLPLLERQAVASEAFSTVTEAVAPVLAAADPPAHADVSFDLSLAAAAGFDELTWLLDRATTMAEAGELLAPTTQPEIRRLRRWVCDQVARQSAGREAVAWLGLTADEPVAGVRRVDWDSAGVLASSEAMIAADDANRILAASPAALQLLGWTLDELVGRRIVSVIPQRFREAHIAAFTLHLLTDSTTILDRTVAVPALHRDGSEVPVDLFVRRETAGGGRAVFIATLRAADVS